jgi:hypothetical protein
MVDYVTFADLFVAPVAGQRCERLKSAIALWLRLVPVSTWETAKNR